MLIKIETLTRIIESTLHAASTDLTRPNYACLQFRADDGLLRVSATNGYWGAVYSLEDSEVESCASVELPLLDAKMALAMLKSYPNKDEDVGFSPASCSIDHDKFTFSPQVQSCNDDSTDIQARISEWVTGAINYIAMSPPRINTIHKAFRAASGMSQDSALEFHMGESRIAPILVTAKECTEYVALLSPCVLEGVLKVTALVQSGTLILMRSDNGEKLISRELVQTSLPGSGEEERHIRELGQLVADREKFALEILRAGRKAPPIVIVPRGAE